MIQIVIPAFSEFMLIKGEFKGRFFFHYPAFPKDGDAYALVSPIIHFSFRGCLGDLSCASIYCICLHISYRWFYPSLREEGEIILILEVLTNIMFF
jgi:hypothetical protein